MKKTLFALFLFGCGPAADHAPALSETTAPQTSPLSPPPGLVRYATGNPADAQVSPRGGLFIMGGGRDVDATFRIAAALADAGDAVVLRTSGSDGYNDYLYSEIGGFDSVETLRLDTRAFADDPWVCEQVRHAELIFIAGGDQATYVASWRDTALVGCVQDALTRGAVLGGTSAGAMVLGSTVFTAARGSVTSTEVLSDPYFEDRVVLEDGLFAVMTDVIVDTHFSERARLGRLIGFMARSHTGEPLLGLGVDERTALFFGPDGLATVQGDGQVHVVYAEAPAEKVIAGEPVTYRGLLLERWAATEAGENIFSEPAAAKALEVIDGVLFP